MTDHLRDATKKVAEPVAWGMPRPDGLILDVICPDEHEIHEGQYTVPLYTQPKADQEPVAYMHCPSVAMDGKIRPVLSFEKYEDDYASGIYAERIPLYAAPQPKAEPCQWHQEDDDTGAWASGCGELWSFIDGGPNENRVRFCHGCGKPVEVQP
jgi:hypothetical protein